MSLAKIPTVRRTFLAVAAYKKLDLFETVDHKNTHTHTFSEGQRCQDWPVQGSNFLISTFAKQVLSVITRSPRAPREVVHLPHCKAAANTTEFNLLYASELEQAGIA